MFRKQSLLSDFQCQKEQHLDRYLFSSVQFKHLRVHRLDSSSSSGIYSYACSQVHRELSWWGLRSSLQLHVAHKHHGSNYSFENFIYTSWATDGRCAMPGVFPCAKDALKEQLHTCEQAE
jgi:hypothetical protein